MRAARPLTEVHPLAVLPRRPRRAGTPPVTGLVGFFGWGNYGDELFLEVFREHLAPAMELRTLIGPDATPTLARRLGGHVRDLDAIVIGGGDLVIPWERGTRYWDRVFLRRPVFLAGIGVPTWRPSQPHVVRRLAEFVGHANVRFIGTRDVESTAWIREHLGPTAPVVTAPDLVFAWTPPPATRPDGPPILGVAVRAGKTDDHLKQVRRLCDRAMERGYRIRRIALSSGLTRRIDVEALEGLDLPDTELVASDDLGVLSRAIGECTLLASMKFHGVIVATMYGVPAIALGATTKHRNLMAALDRSALRVPFNDPSLPDVLDHDIPPVPEVLREGLRRDAIANVADIRARILATVGVPRR